MTTGSQKKKEAIIKLLTILKPSLNVILLWFQSHCVFAWNKQKFCLKDLNWKVMCKEIARFFIFLSLFGKRIIAFKETRLYLERLSWLSLKAILWNLNWISIFHILRSFKKASSHNPVRCLFSVVAQNIRHPLFKLPPSLLRTVKITATQVKSRKIILNDCYADGMFFQKFSYQVPVWHYLSVLFTQVYIPLFKPYFKSLLNTQLLLLKPY